jgi:hypothetical protein
MKITWSQLCKIEPRLKTLYNNIKEIKDSGGPYFCALEVWYGWHNKHSFKQQLCALVGWHAEKDDHILRSSVAYDLAYHKCFNILPPCRNCLCTK